MAEPTQVTVNLEQVHQLSVEMLQDFEESNVPVEIAQVATALTLGRIISPKILTQEEEVAFLEFLMQHLMLYFVQGEAN